MLISVPGAEEQSKGVGWGLGAVRWESRTEGRKQSVDRAQLRDGHAGLWWGLAGVTAIFLACFCMSKGRR